MTAIEPERSVRGPVFEISNLTKRYGRRAVVEDLAFTVEPGRVTGFLGPNGSGKSTTMKILLGLASADQGRATIAGTSYRRLPDPARTVGVLLEANAFHPGRSARNHLRILADATGVPAARCDELLEEVGLAGAGGRRVGAYSLGMRQRLGLAAALLGEPPALVLDEPGNGLDPEGMRALRDVLRARAASGSTVLVSSHLLAEMEHLADEVVAINRGRLVASGSLRDLLQSSALVRAEAPERLATILRSEGGLIQSPDADTLVVRGLSTEQIGQNAFHAGIALYELSPQAGSLEDLFLDWTASSDAGTPSEVASS